METAGPVSRGAFIVRRNIVQRLIIIAGAYEYLTACHLWQRTARNLIGYLTHRASPILWRKRRYIPSGTPSGNLRNLDGAEAAHGCTLHPEYLYIRAGFYIADWTPASGKSRGPSPEPPLQELTHLPDEFSFVRGEEVIGTGHLNLR